MHILIYSYNYHPEPIGIAPLMTQLAEGLVQRGHKVRVVTAMPWYPEGEINPNYRGKYFLTENINGVKVQRSYIWTRRKRNLRNRAAFELSFMILSLLQAFQGSRPDVILLTVPGLPVCLPAALLRLIYRCPIVLNLQDILPDAAVHTGMISNPKVISILKWLEQFAYKTSDKIAVIADGFTNNIVKKGVPLAKIVEIPNWADIDFIRPLPKQTSYFRQKYQLEDKFVVIYSGNIALTQGLETVIDAAVYLQHLPEIAIVIVGETRALSRLESYCQAKNIQNVHLVPFQPQEKLPEMLAAADVGLVVQKKNVLDFNMPSKIPVLLASGRAIIGSVPDTGTAISALKKSGGGLITPSEDAQALATAIIDLYYDREKTARLGKQGRAYAERHYSFALALDRYEELFQKITSNSSTKFS
jgi:colanic acid biosynthesis glycosyl transferase WcaI